MSGCHLWTAATTGDSRSPYGVFWAEGKLVLAHRWIFEQRVGPIPRGLQLDHFVCDTTLCVNPAHVRPAMGRENTLRGLSPAAIAARRSTCVRGHPWNAANTRQRAKQRHCRVCDREDFHRRKRENA